jgi:hypothetical protein
MLIMQEKIIHDALSVPTSSSLPTTEHKKVVDLSPEDDVSALPSPGPAPPLPKAAPPVVRDSKRNREREASDDRSKETCKFYKSNTGCRNGNSCK